MKTFSEVAAILKSLLLIPNFLVPWLSIRFFEIESQNTGKLPRFLESRKTLKILDQTHSQNTMVLLVRHHTRFLQHRDRSSWTLQPASLSYPIFTWVPFICSIHNFIINNLILCFRCDWVLVSGSLHVWNVHQNVCFGTKNLFRIFIQPFRLRCHQWINLWSYLVRGQRRIIWALSSSSPSTFKDIQSYEILVITEKSRYITA